MSPDRAAGWLDVANFFAFKGMSATAAMVLEELKRRNEHVPRELEAQIRGQKRPYSKPSLVPLGPSDPRRFEPTCAECGRIDGIHAVGCSIGGLLP